MIVPSHASAPTTRTPPTRAARIHLIGIPVTNLSVNPALSTGPALFVGGWALQQLWLFWVAPLVGAVLSGFAYRALAEPKPDVAGIATLVVTATTTVR